MKNRNWLVLTVVLALLLLTAALAYRGLAPQVVPAGVPASGTDAAEPQSPEFAPDFTVYDAAGNEIRLSDLRGKPVVINFWATWCPPCRAELPFFDAAYVERGEEIVFLMIDLTDGGRETEEGVQTFLAETGYSFPVYYDTELDAAAAYGVSSIPLTVLIDAEGHVADRHLGSMSEELLDMLLDELNEERR